MSQIFKSTFVVSILSACGLCLGLLCNVAIAAKFGAHQDMDIFLAATTLPLFITSVLSGSLNLTFIPIFAEYRAKEPTQIWKVVSSFINLNIIVTLVVCIVGVILAYPIMKILAPGFNDVELVKSVTLLRILFPIIVLNVINALVSSVYYSNQKFLVPSLNNLISPILIIIYVALFHNILSTKSIAFAMVTAAFIQTCLLVASVSKIPGFNYLLIFDFKHPGVIKILKLMAPLVFGMLIYRATPIFDNYFLSMLPNGSISHIGYAQKLLGVIPQLISSGISITVFPLMAKYAAEKKWTELQIIMSKGIRQVLFFVIPIIFIMSTSGLVVVRLVYERGSFGLEDSIAVSNVFTIYLFSLFFSTANNLTNCYYVLNDTITPLIVGTISTIAYVIACFMLLKMHFGYLTFPMAYFIYFSFVIVHAVIIRKKLNSSGGKRIIASILKFTIVSLTISALLHYASLNSDNLSFNSFLIGVSFLLYYVICNYILHLDEAKIIHRKLAQSFNFNK
ncbi:murein biosynthesis integral membrane protein MurJ [Pelotalea chapellei]|uniref:Lipid II flippase n=1 Tax=Pelotalea chapellei TaxID=44671 RepID=A0ABS5U5M3_9BACT|nr:lipid II flippase MurJ [Pelotalea chapellei]MBT1070972.1 hypothetical protein [Pelotalea chapellei]